MQIAIGIDDTDNLQSRGTGYRARQLEALLCREFTATSRGVTRHQLLFAPEVPYTSHNSSACISVEIEEGDLDRLIVLCRDFLLKESAPGSDAGLCIMDWACIDEGLHAYGRLAKTKVISQDITRRTAQNYTMFLEGLTGDHDGIIGAAAAVGLRHSGNDGRFINCRGARELTGTYTREFLLEESDIDVICDREYKSVPEGITIETGSWPRPILKDGKAHLLVEEAHHDGKHIWRTCPKEYIKSITE